MIERRFGSASVESCGRDEAGRLLAGNRCAYPLSIRKRGGTQVGTGADGAPTPPRAAPQIGGTPVKAIARAFRWRKMLETDKHATIKEIAEAERINPS
jgi:hypothetical protein